jgi:tetratricopeptide (TPR) repeat protein
MFKRTLQFVARMALLPLAVFATMLAQAPTDPLSKPRALLARGLSKDAEVAVDAYLQVNPDSSEAHYLRAEILLREQRAKESLAEFTIGAKGRNPSAREFGMIASDYVLFGDYSDADHWFTEAATREPGEASYWYLLGRTKYKEGQYDAAVNSFEHALSAHPRYVEAENNRGLALAALQKKDAAIEAYQKAIEWQGGAGDDSQPYLNLGTLLLEQGELTRAADLLKKAATISPSNPRMHEELGQAYVQQGDLPLAQHEFEAAIALSPNVSSLHFRLGQIYKKQSKTDLAQREFAACEKLVGTHSSSETPNPYGPE